MFITLSLLQNGGSINNSSGHFERPARALLIHSVFLLLLSNGKGIQHSTFQGLYNSSTTFVIISLKQQMCKLGTFEPLPRGPQYVAAFVLTWYLHYLIIWLVVMTCPSTPCHPLSTNQYNQYNRYYEPIAIIIFFKNGQSPASF